MANNNLKRQFMINSNGLLEIEPNDFYALVDKLVAVNNENFILRYRISYMENIIQWCMQFLAFIHSFTTLIFHNELPLSAIAFNSDLIQMPYKVMEACEIYADKLTSHMASVYNACYMLTPDMATLLDKMPGPRPSSKLFEKKIKKLNEDYELFVKNFHDNRSDFRLVSPFTALDNNTLATLIAKMQEATDSVGLKINPQYLIKQVFLSEMLMKFASTVFIYVPQLKVDFLRADNFSYSLETYANKLVEFWEAQVNVCVEPFHMAYRHKNMVNLQPSEIKQTLSEWLSEAGGTHNLSADTQILLASQTHKSFSNRFVDPVNQQVADAWRRLFSSSINGQKTVNLKPLDEKDRQQLGQQFLADVLSANSNMFDRVILNKTHMIYGSPHSDYLTNLKYTFYEQNCLLKLIIRYLLQRTYSTQKPTADTLLYDPLYTLVDRVFWKPEELYRQN